MHPPARCDPTAANASAPFAPCNPPSRRHRSRPGRATPPTAENDRRQHGYPRRHRTSARRSREHQRLGGNSANEDFRAPGFWLDVRFQAETRARLFGKANRNSQPRRFEIDQDVDIAVVAKVTGSRRSVKPEAATVPSRIRGKLGTKPRDVAANLLDARLLPLRERDNHIG